MTQTPVSQIPFSHPLGRRAGLGALGVAALSACSTGRPTPQPEPSTPSPTPTPELAPMYQPGSLPNLERVSKQPGAGAVLDREQGVLTSRFDEQRPKNEVPLSRVKVQHLFTAFDALRVPSLERAQCNVSSAWTTRAAGCTTPPRT